MTTKEKIPDNQEMNRLFAFGCSSTFCWWPTWADILGREFDHFENWGQGGAGNCFQLYSLIECLKRNTITKDDTIIIMWSSVDREDRWKDGRWLCDGGVYNDQPPYDQDYLEKFADPTGSLIRDMAVISTVRKILESIGCHWYFLSVFPFTVLDVEEGHAKDHDYHPDQKILELYKDDLVFVRPPLYEVIFNGDWFSRKGPINMSPYEERFSQFKGSDWPSWVDFIKNKITDTPKYIIDEIKKILNWKDNFVRTDAHATPLEHLEYLDKVLPEITISNDTREWVKQENELVLKLDKKYDFRHPESWRSQMPEVRF